MFLKIKLFYVASQQPAVPVTFAQTSQYFI